MAEKRLRGVATLVGIALLAVIVAGAVLGSRAAGDDLQVKAERALASADLDGVNVAFHGREAVLSGGTPDELGKAELIVEGIEGVRWADTVSPVAGPTPAPVDTKPTLRLSHSGTGITISGTVPDADAAASIKASVAEAFGVAVAGDLVINPAVGRARWTSQIPDVFGDLVGVKRLAMTIDGQGTLDLAGAIESQAGAAEVSRQVASIVRDLDVVSRLDVEPQGLTKADAVLLNASTLYYPADGSTLGAAHRDLLDRVAAVLRRGPVAIQVNGYAGPQHPGTGERLAVARVAAVKAYLLRAGVPAALIETRIIASHNRRTHVAAKQFRRVDFIVQAG